MVKVIQLADDGTETVAIEVDDFTIEVVYSGIAEMLREAADTTQYVVPALSDLPREARLRRERVLRRMRS
jgi:hypothetical protein